MFAKQYNLNLLFQMLILLFVTTKASAQPQPYCNRTCGTGEVSTRLPFPFGVSDGCKIRLNCSTTTGNILIGDFKVHNFTSDSIFVNIPASCNRPVHALLPLFSRNYAPLSWQNGLLLGNCSNSSSSNSTAALQECDVPLHLMEGLFEGSSSCDLKGEGEDSLKCFTDKDKGFMSNKVLIQSNCNFFFSSIAYHQDERRYYEDVYASVSLDFRMLRLGWWLEGDYRMNCLKDTNYTEISSPFNEQPGYRCTCPQGYKGEAFFGSEGCYDTSTPPSCSFSDYMIGFCGIGGGLGILLRGIIAGAIMMICITLSCKLILGKCRSMRSQRITRRLISDAAGTCSIPFFTYKEIKRATDGFADIQRKGTGAYGTVYAGKLHNDDWVAIKKIRQRDAEGIGKVVNEIKLLSSVSHPNLVRLLGCCIEGGEQILIYEFMSNGTLSQHLQRETGTGLPWTIRLRIATEIAQAISHLHSSSPPIFHRDIKSSNILLDYSFKSKVADFGLSRLGSITELSHISTAPQGTPGYLDPQYHQDFQLSDRSDVYSFGVVLVEIITALKVVDFSRADGEVNLATFAVEKIRKACVNEIIDPFLDSQKDAWTHLSVHKVAELAFRCLAVHRDLRPSMMEIVDELEYIKANTWSSEEKEISPSGCASFSSSFNRSGRKLQDLKGKLGIESRQSGLHEIVMEVSPVSMDDPWFSDDSSPSKNSLLNNIVI
ncbi:hypothetical protein GIB67_007404 [Kingdonia uniflora]|uniref:Protein kinase domain-containing protein n=1 Tax=Kingdonia uniflora TaxID=39325 RepID=A0A7J7MLN9_9MAGN|nr:hypothetical protein GIB67_007404 [Kingdonia uniflora]